MSRIGNSLRISPETGLGALVLLACGTAPVIARADTMLLRDTILVAGSESSVFSFQTPGPGTVSLELTNLDWPQPLTGLSVMATTADQVLLSWSQPSAGPGGPAVEFFHVAGEGNYFADVNATAGGPLALGLYSLSLSFQPDVPAVPLPPAGWLLLSGILALTLVRAGRSRAGTWAADAK